MQNWKRGLAATLLASVLVVPMVSMAEGDHPVPEGKRIIEKTMIKEFNPTWGEAADLQKRTWLATNQLAAANTQLITASGASADAELSVAIDQMKETAGDNLVVMLEEGGTPKITAKDDAPQEAKDVAVEADKAASEGNKVLIQSTKLVEEGEALVEKASLLPDQLKNDPNLLKSNGLKIKDLKKAIEQQNKNLKRLKATVERAKMTQEEATTFVGAIKSLAAAE